MSYDIVQGIKITEDAVIVKSDANNVFPRDYHWRKNDYFTAILLEQGRDKVILEILKAYEEGSYQPGRRNKYTAAIDRLHTMPEYSAFDWRQDYLPYGSDEYKALNESRRSEAFYSLLQRAFNAR